MKQSGLGTKLEKRKNTDIFNGPLFMQDDRTPLTTYQFVTVLSWGLIRLGLPAQEFGSHSFRIWTTTAAAQLGMGARVIQALAFRSIQNVHDTPR